MKVRFCILLCFLCFLLVAAGHTQACADCDLIVASDLHYIAPSLTDGGACYQRVHESGDSKFMPYIEEITEAFFDEVITARPEALLLTGDLSFNGAVISHEALIEKLRTVEAAGILVLVLTGNHDVYNENAARYRGDSFTRVPSASTELFAALYDEFGPGEALSAAPDSLSYVYPLNESTRVLILDLNAAHSFCGLSEASLRWVEQQLRDARAAGESVLAAGHQNLFQHTIFRGGYVFSNADRLASLFRAYGVPLYLSGHLHIQHIQAEDGLTEITTSALCSYPCQYARLQVKEGRIHYETRRLNLAAWAERRGLDMRPYEDFAEKAAAYMSAHFSAAASVPPTADPERCADMSAYLEKLNLAYFSGDLREVAALDPDGSLAAAWLEAGDLTSLYVSSVFKDAGKCFTVWDSILPERGTGNA